MTRNLEPVTRNSLVTCTRRIEFDAAHRVMEHEGKCKDVHGHRYALEATFAANADGPLDTLGRVIDFAVLRDILGAWINRYWDHTLILYGKDKALGQDVAKHTGQEVFYLPSNPTAENMALYLLQTVCPTLFASHGVTCTAIRLWETPNCSAEAKK